MVVTGILKKKKARGKPQMTKKENRKERVCNLGTYHQGVREPAEVFDGAESSNRILSPK